MAQRYALVIVNGQIQQLQPGDTLAGGGSSGVPYQVDSTEIYEVPNKIQALYSVPILYDGVIKATGILREVN